MINIFYVFLRGYLPAEIPPEQPPVAAPQPTTPPPQSKISVQEPTYHKY